MNYKNGKEVLPPNLLSELQKYIQGELVYIPKKSKERAAWGEISGSRKLIRQRNDEIFILYSKGWSIEKLERKYHLSSESIRKIIIKTRTNREKGVEHVNT